MSLDELRGDVVILACAISAGIHGALVPAHFAASTGAGVGFLAAALSLGALAVWLTRRPESTLARAAAAVVLVGLLVSYAFATTTGLPVLHPDPEPADGLGLATKATEAVGLLATVRLAPRRATLRQPKETLT